MQSLPSHCFASSTVCLGYSLFCQALILGYAFGSYYTLVLAITSGFSLVFLYITSFTSEHFWNILSSRTLDPCVSDAGTNTPPVKGCLIYVPSPSQDDPSLLNGGLELGLCDICVSCFKVSKVKDDKVFFTFRYQAAIFLFFFFLE